MFSFLAKSFPFATDNPVAYIIAFISECLAILCMGYVVVVLTSLAFGSFLLSLTLIDDMKGTLNSINKSTKSKQNGSLDIRKELAHFMDFMSNGKQLSDKC